MSSCNNRCSKKPFSFACIILESLLNFVRMCKTWYSLSKNLKIYNFIDLAEWKISNRLNKLGTLKRSINILSVYQIFESLRIHTRKDSRKQKYLADQESLIFTETVRKHLTRQTIPKKCNHIQFTKGDTVIGSALLR